MDEHQGIIKHYRCAGLYMAAVFLPPQVLQAFEIDIKATTLSSGVPNSKGI